MKQSYMGCVFFCWVSPITIRRIRIPRLHKGLSKRVGKEINAVGFSQSQQDLFSIKDGAGS